MLARLFVPAVGAIALQALGAEEPATTTPPATSIREWRATPSPAPNADAAATLTFPATSISEWLAMTGPVPAVSPAATPTPPATSIREWRTTSSPAPGPCPMTSPIANLSATPAASPSAKPAVGAAVATSPVTISIKSMLRQGTLVVALDGVPVFKEKFQKPLLAISQTTTWDPLLVVAGTHRLTATVHGTKKTYTSKTYDLQLSRTNGATLRFVMRGDKLTVELGS